MTMEHDRKSVEFDSIIDNEGKITVPSSLLDQFRKRSPAKLRVRLSGHVIAAELTRKNVSEEEIERVGALQLESRDQVVKFLLSELALQGNKRFKRRATRKGAAG